VMIAVIALMNVDFDHTRYEAGKRFELPENQAKELVELGAARLAPSDAGADAPAPAAGVPDAAQADLKAALDMVESLHAQVATLTAERDAALAEIEALREQVAKPDAAEVAGTAGAIAAKGKKS
jgi:hypothetical protein